MIPMVLFGMAYPKQARLNNDVSELKVYDVPFKTQYSERLVLRKPMDKAGLKHLLNGLFDAAMRGSYKYHNPPTHIFIYIYNSKADLNRDGSSWVGMISRTMDKNEGIQLK